MKCPHCTTENRTARRFCSECGSTLPRACSNCGFANAEDDKFCGACGRPLRPENKTASDREVLEKPPIPGQLTQKIEASRTALEGERRQVTVLFADMQGYTPLAERLGAEAVYGLMQRVYERMLTCVHRQEGTVQELTGDGILALFGAPIALEDAPIRAGRAALDIQAQMQDLGTELETEYGVRPRLRIGMHTGPVVIGTVGTDLRMEFKAVGDTVNLASRLESMAEPGTILISETTCRLIADYFETRFEAERPVKGKAVPQRVYRLHGIEQRSTRFDASLSRGLTPLVGRSDELAVLDRCLRESASGRACVVHIVGEAGIGKSRLLYDFTQRLQEGGMRILEGHFTRYGQATAFFPFVEIVRTILGLDDSMRGPEATHRIHEKLRDLGLQAKSTLPFLLNLLGMDPGERAFQGLDGEIVGARTRETLQQVCEAACDQAVTVILLEDLHWTDSASEELLRGLIAAGKPAGSLVLMTCRPEYSPPWLDAGSVIRMELAPLPEDSCQRLVEHCLYSYQARGEMVQRIVQRVEGNPLFAEEFSRLLVDSGTALSESDLTDDLERRTIGRIPETLNDIIMARVDALDEETRSLLQLAAVAGRQWPTELISSAWDGTESVPRLLQMLEERALVVQPQPDEKQIFQFKHVLIQEVVYDSLLSERKKTLHERIAEALETLYPDRLGEWAEVLAHHWVNTRQCGQAIRYMALAAQKSLRLYSLDEADQWFRQAVERIDAMPERNDDRLLAEVLLSWVRVYYYRKDFRGLAALLEKYLKRTEKLRNRRFSSLTHFWLGFSNYFGARFEKAEALLRKALELGEDAGDKECIAYASMGLMFVCSHTQNDGAEETIVRLSERGLALALELDDVYLQSKYHLCMFIHYVVTGRYQQSRHSCERMQALGERARDPRTLGMSYWSLAFADIFEERFEQAIANADASLQISPDPMDRLMARGARGAALAFQGNAVEGLTVLRQVRKEMLDGDYLTPLLGIEYPYGAAMVLAGQMAAGVHWIEESAQRFAKQGQKSQAAFGKIVLGEIYLEMVLGENRLPARVVLKNLGFILRNLPLASRKTRHYLQQAVVESRSILAPAILARGLFDLGRLQRKANRVQQARALLLEARDIAEPHSLGLYAKIVAVLDDLSPSQEAD